jgi:8-oxo-dGTP pyrophosphatase MutT (NUDIX family)
VSSNRDRGFPMTQTRVVGFERLELRFASKLWPFAQQRRAQIDAHFAHLRDRNPHLWNGRVLLLHDFATGPDVFRGDYLETDFASFLAWRDWDFPDHSIRNCFGMAVLRGTDGAFLLGVMADHTANAGKVYFVGGTPDPNDIDGCKVDLHGSVLRELAEETGLSTREVAPERGWYAVFAGLRIAMLKVLNAPVPAATLREQILRFLASQARPELADIRIVNGPGDLCPQVPTFVSAFLDHIWRSPEPANTAPLGERSHQEPT